MQNLILSIYPQKHLFDLCFFGYIALRKKMMYWGVEHERKVEHPCKALYDYTFKNRTDKTENNRLKPIKKWNERWWKKMNKGINYGKGYVNEILQLLHICGVIPYHSLQLLSDNHRMYQRAVKKMEKDGTIQVDKRGGEKNMRLRNHRWRRADYENYIPLEYMNYYETTAVNMVSNLSDGSKNRTTPSRTLKNASTQIMMYACGIEISPDKRDLRKEMLEDDDLAYYSSNEIKQLETYHDIVTKSKKEGVYSKKLINSRINGVMISPGGIYAVYNTGNTLMEWKRYGEVKMAAYIASIVRHKSTSDISISDPKEAIVIARNDSLFTKICLGHYKKNSKIILMNIDYAYDRLYAIPESREGIIHLKMMITNGWRGKILDSVLSKEEQLAKKEVSIECDGYDSQEGIYKLVFCIPDLQKLKSFTARASLANERSRYHIYCYSYQTKMIIDIAGLSVTILKMDIKEFYSKFF